MKIKKRILCVVTAMSLVASSVSVTIPANSTNAEAKASYVYIAASGRGKCYHLSAECSRMRGRVKKMKLKQAKKAGYRPCGKCYS